MWKEILKRLYIDFPGAIKLNQPASLANIVATELSLGIKIVDVDLAWREFLELTDGVSILDYDFMSAGESTYGQIGEYNRILREANAWTRDKFVCFMTDSTGMTIGFAISGSKRRGIVYLSQSYDEIALPIASCFSIFMTTFLQDIERTLMAWETRPGKEIPLGISEPYWPFDLNKWLTRDPSLRDALSVGELDDLFRHNKEYSEIVARALRGIPQDFKPPPFCSEQG